jgi:tetratricopeptide (TPR) repeat protein
MMAVPGVALLIALVLCVACATSPVAAVRDIQPGERPSPRNEEAGLWMQMDRIEQELRTSGRVVTEPALNDYVRGVVCGLAPDYCQGLRIYIVDVPHFNATMAPNGKMEVWTGLLLRVQNEAQLASILAHEIAHYQKRLSLKQWLDARRRADWHALAQIAAAAAGSGYASNLAQLLYLASGFKFSRDQEREADRVGFELMASAGYAPEEAAKLWTALIEEDDASGKSEPSILFSTHPTDTERVASLGALAHALGDTSGVVGRGPFLEHVLPLRGDLLEAELRQRRFARSRVILERLRTEGEARCEIDFYLGELYRERGEPGDEREALGHYRRALEGEGAPPETWRSIGWVERRLGNDAEARNALLRYLALDPAAEDRALIEAWLGDAR